jgi:protein gp37
MFAIHVSDLLERGDYNLWVIENILLTNDARPVMQEWVTDIREQCLRVKVPFFFKQWGGVQKKRAGRTLEGHTWDEMPVHLVMV